jgi:hypothetical protein
LPYYCNQCNGPNSSGVDLELADDATAKRRERLIPARREPSQLLINEIEFFHHLRIGFSRLIGLTKGEAVGIEVIHVACLGLAGDQKYPVC